MTLDYFYGQCALLADHIDAKREDFHDILVPYQTYEVVEHEIKSAISSLRNIEVEYKGFEQPRDKVTASCFLPVNMPLYSLILYAVLPSYYFETLYVRPGMSLCQYVPALVEKLELYRFGFNQIKIKDLPAKLFTDLYAKDSEVILFTGKYSNAQMLERECPESMLIFEGTGPCPFIVFENADTVLAAQKAVAMRCFNSGQDCVAPDVLFVHKSKLKDFQDNLVHLLEDVRVGSSKDPSVRVAQAIKEEYFFSVQEWLEVNRNDIVAGGEIDTEKLIIHPTVLSRDITRHDGPYKELFSPIFYILSYNDDQQLLEKINEESFKKRSMYACVFGENNNVTKDLSLCTILKNMTVNDQEDGNRPYGGYGQLANFISYKGNRRVKPLLISRDVREWMLFNKSHDLANHAIQVA